MIVIGVKSSIDQVIKQLSAFDAEQLPFAASRALNDTAYQGRKAVQAIMPSEFTIRRDWIIKGVSVLEATKTSLSATVYQKDDFMYRQEVGGEKIPVNGGHAIAVPLRSAFPIGQVIPDDMRPRNLVNTLTSKGSARGIADTALVTLVNGKRFLARLNPGATRGNRLEFLYILLPSVSVKPRFNLAATVYRVVRAKFMDNLAVRINEAMATAKRK